MLKMMAFEQGGDDGTLRYQDKLCVPTTDGLSEGGRCYKPKISGILST